jgi:hypothetical protein
MLIGCDPPTKRRTTRFKKFIEETLRKICAGLELTANVELRVPSVGLITLREETGRAWLSAAQTIGISAKKLIQTVRV